MGTQDNVTNIMWFHTTTSARYPRSI